MSAAANAGASTSTSTAPAYSIASRERFIQNPIVNITCFNIVNRIARAFANKKNFRFFVKGGAAADLFITGNPQAIINDIDCALLINPALTAPRFEKRRTNAICTSVNRIVQFLNNLDPAIYNEIQRQFVHSELVPLSTPPSVRVGSATLDGYSLLEGINECIRVNTLKPECPLLIDIWPSLMFGESSLQMAVIKLRTNTVPYLDLLDIAVPAQTYPRLPHEWDTYATMNFKVHELEIPILNLFAQINNQQYAESKTIVGHNERYTAKAKRRKERSEALIAIRNSTIAGAGAGTRAASGAAGGAGAVAPAYRNANTRKVHAYRNSTGTLRFRMHPSNIASLPMGKPLSFKGPALSSHAKALLDAGILVHAIDPRDRAWGVPPGRAPRRAFIKSGVPAGSNTRLFETTAEGVPHKYYYIGPDGHFYLVVSGVVLM
jgi:hypothetical protein